MLRRKDKKEKSPIPRKKNQIQMIPISVVLPLFLELPEGYRLSAFIEKRGKTSNTRYDINSISSRENVGYAVLKRAKDQLFFDGVFVLPNHRNKGIASYLINTVLLNNSEDIFLRARPFKDKSVGREELITLYERFGFEIVGKNDLMIRRMRNS